MYTMCQSAVSTSETMNSVGNTDKRIEDADHQEREQPSVSLASSLSYESLSALSSIIQSRNGKINDDTATATPTFTITTIDDDEEEGDGDGSQVGDENQDGGLLSRRPGSAMDDDDDPSNWEDLTLLNGDIPLQTLAEPSWKQCFMYWACWTIPICVCDLARLILFVVLLAPAYARFLAYYLTTDRIVVRYGDSNKKAAWRRTMDIYGSQTSVKTTAGDDATSTVTTPLVSTNEDNNNNNTTQTKKKKPVLIFFTGGAWMIGYKAWGAFVAKVFAAMGVMVVVPDYPNYPQVTVPEMVRDTEEAIQYILDNIEAYGGDPQHTMIAGQSAGGHLVAVVLLQKALQLLKQQQERQQQGITTPIEGFHPRQLRGFCAISTPSDVQAMTTNFQKHGLDQTFVQSLFGVRRNTTVRMDDYDPQRIVEQLQVMLQDAQEKIQTNDNNKDDKSDNKSQPLQTTNAKIMPSILPPISIFHGTADKTVPYEVSERFAASLSELGVVSEYIAYEGWSHTDPILEAVMMADHRFHADLYARLYKWMGMPSSIPKELDDSIPECQPLCSDTLVQAARFCNPF